MAEHTRDPSVSAPAAGNPTGWDPATGEWEHATLRRATDHGVRLFNDGAYHESHDCFEVEWFNYGQGTAESAFAHGMVQVAAGALKRDRGYDEGMASLFATAGRYLQGLPADFYGVDLRHVRTTIALALDDPSVVDDWQIPLDGSCPMARAANYDFVDALE